MPALAPTDRRPIRSLSSYAAQAVRRLIGRRWRAHAAIGANSSSASWTPKAQFRSLAEPWADTGTSTGRLMIGVLGGLADVERDLIRTRTAEGRIRAQKRGQHMGRPPKLTPHQQAEARQRRAQ